jgi:hypothetical protein
MDWISSRAHTEAVFFDRPYLAPVQIEMEAGLSASIQKVTNGFSRVILVTGNVALHNLT